jgi:large subunit ribosomal protein L19
MEAKENETTAIADTPAPAAAPAGDPLNALRNDIPDLRPGDEIKVSYRVIEGDKERIQTYEGTIIALKNSGVTRTVTVRKTSFGIAVERIFPLESKLVQKIEIKRRTKVRRAKLYFLRKLKGKASRLKELRQ